MKNKRPGVAIEQSPSFKQLALSRGLSEEDAAIIGKVGDYAYEQELKAIKERSLLQQEVGKITLGEFLDALGRESKERVELAGILRNLSRAIDGMELSNVADDSRAEKRMAALKNLRETFNRIPPKWFHG